MTLMEQAERRVALARQTRRAPLRSIATEAVATELERGDTCYGLELVCARPE